MSDLAHAILIKYGRALAVLDRDGADSFVRQQVARKFQQLAKQYYTLHATAYEEISQCHSLDSDSNHE